MRKSLLNHQKLRVTERTTTVGPPRDPTERHIMTISNDNAVAEIITDYGIKFVFNGFDLGYAGTTVQLIDDLLTETFGYNRKQITRIGRKLVEQREKYSCPMGGRHDLDWVEGYPGEHLQMCSKCHKVLDFFFCPEEVA